MKCSCLPSSLAFCARVQSAHLPTRSDSGNNLSFCLSSLHFDWIRLSGRELFRILRAGAFFANAPQHAFSSERSTEAATDRRRPRCPRRTTGDTREPRAQWGADGLVWRHWARHGPRATLPARALPRRATPAARGTGGGASARRSPTRLARFSSLFDK